MLIIPYSAVLKFGKPPWISWSIIIVPILIFNEQVVNKNCDFAAVMSYYNSICQEELMMKAGNTRVKI